LTTSLERRVTKEVVFKSSNLEKKGVFWASAKQIMNLNQKLGDSSMKNFSLKLVLASILIITISNFVPAQTFLFQDIPKEKTQLGLRFMRPMFDGDPDLSSLSGIYDFTLNIPINENWSIAGSLPYITATFGERNADNGIGNIYIGMQNIRNIDDQQSTIVSFGFYLPTADEDIGLFGIRTHFYEFHKYAPDVLTIYGNFAYFNIFPQGARLGLEIGPNLWIPTQGDAGDTELLLHYGLTAGFQGNNFALLTELVGVVIITDDTDEFSDRFSHSINFGANYVSKSVTPGIFYKLYLKEDLSDFVDGVFGINIDVTIN
jgi:hypothetical protein